MQPPDISDEGAQLHNRTQEHDPTPQSEYPRSPVSYVQHQGGSNESGYYRPNGTWYPLTGYENGPSGNYSVHLDSRHGHLPSPHDTSTAIPSYGHGYPIAPHGISNLTTGNEYGSLVPPYDNSAAPPVIYSPGYYGYPPPSTQRSQPLTAETVSYLRGPHVTQTPQALNQESRHGIDSPKQLTLNATASTFTPQASPPEQDGTHDSETTDGTVEFVMGNTSSREHAIQRTAETGTASDHVQNTQQVKPGSGPAPLESQENAENIHQQPPSLALVVTSPSNAGASSAEVAATEPGETSNTATPERNPLRWDGNTTHRLVTSIQPTAYPDEPAHTATDASPDRLPADTCYIPHPMITFLVDGVTHLECQLCQVRTLRLPTGPQRPTLMEADDEGGSGGVEMPALLPCGHCFGATCLTRWLAARRAHCPLCGLSLRHADCGHALERPHVLDARSVLAVPRILGTGGAADAGGGAGGVFHERCRRCRLADLTCAEERRYRDRAAAFRNARARLAADPRSEDARRAMEGAREAFENLPHESRKERILHLTLLW